ncbi:HPr kinase/phosphorylase [Roseococcus pinisoli]|uniref:HPr kinase/phosphorylase n=1 Tax=Roseococcus pinisoli TaxID=2835040 RepID=UPI0024BF02E9|nr:HPr kinase/phosphatase C-terminal domain-containing protein [Roseococcus pinisoli]
MLFHASCAALDGEAVLILAPPGAGKSDLLLRLMGRGWSLVSDDQVVLKAVDGRLEASPPPALAGRMEVFGLGIVEGLSWVSAPLRLVVRLVAREEVVRLPVPRQWEALGLSLPLLETNGAAPSAPDVLACALGALAQRHRLSCGAFAA